MDRLSDASRRQLQSLEAPRGASDTRITKAQSRPVAVQVEDPLSDLMALANVIQDGPVERPPNAWLKAQRQGAAGLGRRVPTVDGRLCCVLFLQTLDRRLHLLSLPSRHECPECGTTWSVEQRVKGEIRGR